MPNMSYCRFQNTACDLLDCLEALEGRADLSRDECDAAQSMFREFLIFCKNEEIIDDYDQERILELLRELRRGGD